jgi:hypothetical protein
VKIGSFRGRPSKQHLLWTQETRDGATTRRFDDDRFRQWVEHCGFDFDKSIRTDHDRAEEARTQFRCVFRWGRMKGEQVELDGESWDLGNQRTPLSFIEIDEEGLARVKAGSAEEIFDLVELRYDGATLLLETANGKKTKLDGKKLAGGGS